MIPAASVELDICYVEDLPKGRGGRLAVKPSVRWAPPLLPEEAVCSPCHVRPRSPDMTGFTGAADGIAAIGCIVWIRIILWGAPVLVGWWVVWPVRGRARAATRRRGT